MEHVRNAVNLDMYQKMDMNVLLMLVLKDNNWISMVDVMNALIIRYLLRTICNVSINVNNHILHRKMAHAILISLNKMLPMN